MFGGPPRPIIRFSVQEEPSVPRYPEISVGGPTPPNREMFGGPPRPIIRFSVQEEPSVPRCWLTGTELIQIQKDRFIFNWRKREPTQVYPRYPTVRRKFERHLAKFQTFLRRQRIGKIVPRQCEVTYVNELFPSKVWKRHGQLDKVYSPWSGRHSDRFLSEPEDVSILVRYRLVSDDGRPLGRLSASSDSQGRVPWRGVGAVGNRLAVATGESQA